MVQIDRIEDEANEKVKVTVYCTCYNHEKYIKKTLEGFLKQKTTFRYEVIIHDDASTDNSAKIIEEYTKKNPDIFISILQKENQYSKKVKIRDLYIYPLIKGEYVAACEGDDYWDDENKLQEQVEILERNSDCVLCTHQVRKITEDGRLIEGDVIPRKELGLKEGILSKDEFMMKLLSEGYIFHTSSFMYRKRMLDLIVRHTPKFYEMFPTKDFAMLVYLADIGGCYYIDKPMSVYRTNAIGGWTTTLRTDVTNMENRYQRGIKALECLDVHTANRFSKEIEYAIARNKVLIYTVTKEYRYLLKNLKYVSFKQGRIKYIILGMIDICLPDLLKKIKSRESHR